MPPKKDEINYIVDALKEIYQLWRHENEIANQKISIYFAAQSILIVALISNPVTTSIIGLVLSIFWFVSIGRTIVYRDHWKIKGENILRSASKEVRKYFTLYPTEAEMKQVAWYGRIPSNIILLWTPMLGILFWSVNLFFYLRK